MIELRSSEGMLVNYDTRSTTVVCIPPGGVSRRTSVITLNTGDVQVTESEREFVLDALRELTEHPLVAPAVIEALSAALSLMQSAAPEPVQIGAVVTRRYEQDLRVNIDGDAHRVTIFTQDDSTHPDVERLEIVNYETNTTVIATYARAGDTVSDISIRERDHSQDVLGILCALAEHDEIATRGRNVITDVIKRLERDA